MVITGYDASAQARDLANDCSSRVTVPGKRYAVTTFVATNNGAGLRGISADVNLEHLVGGVTTTFDDECTFFTDDDYHWSEALETAHAEIMSGATGEPAICRLVSDEDLNDVQLVIEPKNFGHEPIIAAVQ